MEVAHEPDEHRVAVTVRGAAVAALPAILVRVRRVFDLDADVEAIGAHLARDPLLAPLVAERPGLRLPGAWDGLEIAVRALLAQQITTAAAARLASQLIGLAGWRIPEASGGLTHAFPSAGAIALADLGGLGMPSARKSALLALAAAAQRRAIFEAGRDPIAELRALPGIGDWTLQCVALRALGDTDAFPATDAVLARALAGSASGTPRRRDVVALLARAETWRPWRGYAAQHLWAASAARKGRDNEARVLRGSDRLTHRRAPRARR